MRFVGLALLLASLPLLVHLLKNAGKRRDLALMAIGALCFAVGKVSVDAALVSRAGMPGTSQGILLSLIDIIAIALLLTRSGKARVPPFLVASALFAIPMIVATPLAMDRMAATFSVAQLAQVLLLFFVLSHELTRPGAIVALLKGFAIGLIVQAGFVIQQKLTGVVQATGTGVHQNILGMMVQLSVMPLLAAAMEGQRSKLIYAGILAGCICVAGGGSRASLAFMALALMLTIALSLLRRSTPRKWKLVGLSIALSAVIVPLALATLQDRFGTLEIRAGDESRDAFERAARAIAADHPLGVGPNNFVLVNNTQGYASRAGIEWGGGLRDKPAHNAYLLARAETGWAGQATLVLLIALIGFRAYRTAFADRKLPILGVAAGSAAGITSVALHSNYEYAIYLLEVQRLFFVNAAIVAACFAISAETRRRKAGARPQRTGSAEKAADEGGRRPSRDADAGPGQLAAGSPLA
jgi:hypothetical protein